MSSELKVKTYKADHLKKTSIMREKNSRISWRELALGSPSSLSNLYSPIGNINSATLSTLNSGKSVVSSDQMHMG
jgi:hypothetical protein